MKMLLTLRVAENSAMRSGKLFIFRSLLLVYQSGGSFFSFCDRVNWIDLYGIEFLGVVGERFLY